MKLNTAILIDAVPDIALSLYRFAYCLTQEESRAEALCVEALLIQRTVEAAAQWIYQKSLVLEREQSSQAVQAMLWPPGLEGQERAALFLQMQLGFSLSQMATVLECTTGCVASALIRGRRSLKASKHALP